MTDELHKRLVDRQSLDELKRKQRKAQTKHYWTQEDIDLANREAKRLHERLRWLTQ